MRKTSKYIVCSNMRYYPWVDEFDTLEEAEKAYASHDTFMQDIFLCEIIRAKEETS